MFYDIFAALCEARRISPSKAAEECGINKSNVSNWKNNGYVPRGEALNKIANYFGVSTDLLLHPERAAEADFVRDVVKKHEMISNEPDSIPEDVKIMFRNKTADISEADKLRLYKFLDSTIDSFLEALKSEDNDNTRK